MRDWNAFLAKAETAFETADAVFDKFMKWNLTAIFLSIIAVIGVGMLAVSMEMQHHRHVCEGPQGWARQSCAGIAVFPPVRVPYPEAQAERQP